MAMNQLHTLTEYRVRFEAIYDMMQNAYRFFHHLNNSTLATTTIDPCGDAIKIFIVSLPEIHMKTHVQKPF